MNPLSLLLAFAAPVLSGPSQAPAKPAAPPLPPSIAEVERTALNEAAQLVARGEFEKASLKLASLTPSAATKLWIDWTPLPRAKREEYRMAVQQAIQNWNAALGGAVTFSSAAREEEADVLVLFDRMVAELKFGQPQLRCSDIQMEASGSRRMATVRIALSQPGSVNAHSPASVAHLLGQGLGSYLGLSQTNKDFTGIMAPDLHAEPPTVKPNPSEVNDAKQLLAARVKLADFAKRRVAIYVPRPGFKVDKLRMDAGDVWRGDHAKYVFTIKNTGDAPLEIDAKPNCGCTVASYDRVVAPGAETQIVADLNTSTFRGKISKAIDIKTNDLGNPSLSLQLLANVRSVISVTPSESPVIGLSSSGPTTQELQIKIDSPMEPVQVTRVACSSSYATAKLEPVQDGGTGTTYKVVLTIGPAAPMGRSAFVVSAFTTSKREPQVNITAILEKGVIVMPPSAYMGSIGPQSILPLNQFVTVSKRDGQLKIQKVETDDPKLEVTQNTVKEGQQYQLRLSYRGGWPSGIVQRKIIVTTDDPAQPRIEIPVTANVLAGAPAGTSVGAGK